MKTRTALLLFAFFTSAVVAQEKPGLYFTCAAADQYPARIAYEILDANEQRLAVGFAEVQSPVDTAYVEVQLPERFMVQVYEDANRSCVHATASIQSPYFDRVCADIQPRSLFCLPLAADLYLRRLSAAPGNKGV